MLPYVQNQRMYVSSCIYINIHVHNYKYTHIHVYTYIQKSLRTAIAAHSTWLRARCHGTYEQVLAYSQTVGHGMCTRWNVRLIMYVRVGLHACRQMRNMKHESEYAFECLHSIAVTNTLVQSFEHAFECLSTGTAFRITAPDANIHVRIRYMHVQTYTYTKHTY